MRSHAIELVIDPGGDGQRRVPFTVSEADVDDAIDYGRAERDAPLADQFDAAAYHMVLELRVCTGDDIELPWVLVRNGRIVGRNAAAMGVSESDLG